MANRLFNPNDTYFSADGTEAAAGYQLFFYQSGTSTKLNTYSDEDLTIPNSNPVVLDSAGRTGPIFLQNLPYKVVLAPATDTDPPTAPIWTADPVYASDYSTVAQFYSVNGSPNGVLAGNQGSATQPASVAWDFTNNVLYVCTLTGTSSTAVWSAVNSSSTANVNIAPQGYLTPVSGTPIITGDAIAATSIYYTPYKGILVPIYNGTTLISTSIVSELSYTLTSSLSANNIYDCFIFSLNGVVTLGTGPSWAAGTSGSITPGSCARGTGTGGTSLSMIQGILTNTVSMSIRYGDGTNTITVAPNEATYVGSIWIDGTNGQVTCHRSFGQSRKFGLWNAYNRVPIRLLVGDSTTSWTYNSSTVRPANNNTANSGSSFTGLAEEWIDSSYFAAQPHFGNNGFADAIGLGFNSTTAFSGFYYNTSADNSGGTGTVSSRYEASPSLGINTVTCLESASASTTTTFFGTQTSMQLTIGYDG